MKSTRQIPGTHKLSCARAVCERTSAEPRQQSPPPQQRTTATTISRLHKSRATVRFMKANLHPSLFMVPDNGPAPAEISPHCALTAHSASCHFRPTRAAASFKTHRHVPHDLAEKSGQNHMSTRVRGRTYMGAPNLEHAPNNASFSNYSSIASIDVPPHLEPSVHRALPSNTQCSARIHTVYLVMRRLDGRLKTFFCLVLDPWREPSAHGEQKPKLSSLPPPLDTLFKPRGDEHYRSNANRPALKGADTNRDRFRPILGTQTGRDNRKSCKHNTAFDR